MWVEVLKMGRRYTPDPTKEEYEQMSSDEKRTFHVKMLSRERKRKNKKLVAFHAKMARQIKLGRDSYYSIKHAPSNIFQSVKRGRTENKEEYEKMSSEEKIRFHDRMRRRYMTDNKTDFANFHAKMSQGIKGGLKTYYSPLHAPDLPTRRTKWAETTKEQYYNLPYHDKGRYHGSMAAKNKHIAPLRKFHNKMRNRFIRGTRLPTAFSPTDYEYRFGKVEAEPQEKQPETIPKKKKIRGDVPEKWKKYLGR